MHDDPDHDRALRLETPSGPVSAILNRPVGARWLLVLAHGAGADMQHPFMEAVARRLASHRVASLRYRFPYAEQGRRAPDRPPVLMATVRAAVEQALQLAGDLPLLAGGKSMGGRMSSLAAAEAPLPGVKGLVFFGFPLHPAARPDTRRAEHLKGLALPMLFLQGDRDRLADLKALHSVLHGLGAGITLRVVPDGDHSFHVPKRSGRSDAQVLDELARAVSEWADRLHRDPAREAHTP